ncbi:MAG: cyanophycin synthetase [Candidatus Paceibacterota bacterium]|jgi:UDP-N-acetylmuramoylalanine--D-glutamate ligase
MSSRDYFKGKRIAIIGLGPNGEMVEDVKYLIKTGALVSVYDMKSEARVKSHLIFLRSLGLANYVCGSIPSDDLLDMDIIVLSHEYTRDATFLKPANEKGVIVEYPETLFLKRAPPVTIVGIMGDCGKTTVISMLIPLLESVSTIRDEQGLFKIDPESSDGIIANLKKIKNGDLVVMKISPTIMIEMTRIRMSPHVAVFTTVPGPGSYEVQPFEILSFQTYNNFIVASDEVIDDARKFKDLPSVKMLRTRSTLLPTEWILRVNGAHDRDNAALALQTARLFKIEDDDAEHILMSWKPLRGRLEFIKKVRNVEFYNDGESTNALATEIAITSLVNEKNIVLIFGGADTFCDYSDLYSILPTSVHTIVLVPGSGTIRERVKLDKIENMNIISVPTIEEAVRLAMDNAKKGDRVLFSPAFQSIGIDGSTKQRSERFVKAVRGL